MDVQLLNKEYLQSGLTYSDIAERTNLPASLISRYVNGRIKTPNEKFYEPIRKVIIDEMNKTDKTVSGTINEIDTEELRNKMMNNGIKPCSSSNTSSSNTSNQVSYCNPRRGEIWFVKNNSASYNEIWGGRKDRPCVVLQNDKLYNDTIIIAYLTKQPKEENPTNVTIQANTTSILLGSQINAISKKKFINCIGKVSEADMATIEKAVLTALDIKVNTKSEINHSIDYIKIKTELEIYKKFYEDYIAIQMNR